MRALHTPHTHVAMAGLLRRVITSSASLTARALISSSASSTSCYHRKLHCSSSALQQSEHVVNASEGLLKAVNTELKLHGKDFLALPSLTAFDCAINGAIATFTRKKGNEEVVVTLDANSAVELDSVGGDFSADEGEEEDGGVITAPVFSVTVTKPSGNKLQFECSFNMDYDDVNDSDALRWNIDSVCVVPSDCKQVESVYSVETDQLSQEVYRGLESYLAECGVDESFGMDLHNFYGAFEHRTYITNFLENVKKYCSE